MRVCSRVIISFAVSYSAVLCWSIFNHVLSVTAEEARQIEVQTREQANSAMWYEARQLRLTASLFGRVRQLKLTTAPVILC